MSESTPTSVSLKDSIFLLLEGNLKRVFATKIGYTTFREVQNVIFGCTENDQNLANFVFEMLINGKLPSELNPSQTKNAHALISAFMIPIRVAKEVHEKGEFINFITSDMLIQQEKCTFLNRLARIDGEEFLLMADIQNTTHLIRHFISRLLEAQKHVVGQQNLAEIKDDLSSLRNYLDELIKSLEDIQ